MAAIRVLQVFTIMDRGGAESMIMNYYRELDKKKIQFDFLVHRKKKGAFDDEIRQLGGQIHIVDAINPFNPTSYYQQLRVFFGQHSSYKIIHSHLNTFSCFPLKIAAEFNIPCRIAHAHIAIDALTISSFFNHKESFKENLKKLIKHYLKKRVKNNATHLFSCGLKAGHWLFGESSEFITMNNAIDTRRFKVNGQLQAKLREEFSLQDKRIVGHVGRFASQKNHDFLIKIFEAVLKQDKKFHLILVGDGILRSKIESEVHKMKLEAHVSFLGVRSDIPELLQVFDIFLFPSFYEGLPVTLIEAQSAGLKVVASDSITREVQLTDDIRFISLTKSADDWAKEIVQIEIGTKTDNRLKIIEGGYDIISNTRAIESFYMQQL